MVILALTLMGGMVMKRAELMNLVGREVIIVLNDNQTIKGRLGYVDEFSAKHDYRKPKYFYVGDMSFKVSHVKTLSWR